MALFGSVFRLIQVITAATILQSVGGLGMRLVRSPGSLGKMPMWGISRSWRRRIYLTGQEPARREEGHVVSCQCYIGRAQEHARGINLTKRYLSQRNENSGNTGSYSTVGAMKVLRLMAETEEDMEEIAYLVSSVTLAKLSSASDGSSVWDAHRRGLVIFLQGDLGAGKTTFARGFLRAATCDWTLRVTSPTYLLSNTYTAPTPSLETDGSAGLDIHHMDLYRLSGTRPQELMPLNLPYVFENCVSLIEWPNRLPEAMIPTERLEITITMAENCTIIDDSQLNARTVTLTPFGESWNERVHKLVNDGCLDDLVLDEYNSG